MSKTTYQAPEWEERIEVINKIFLVIFVMEAALKIVCMGPFYFYDEFNRFDFCIVCISLTNQILEMLDLNPFEGPRILETLETTHF